MRALFIALLAACGSAASMPAPTPQGAADAAPMEKARLAQVDVAGLETALAAGARLIDVRTPEEFAAGHVAGAVNVPLGFDAATEPALADFKKDQPLYVICQSGGRSSRASAQLAAAGFWAVNVNGGTSEWVASGKPAVTP
jgi:phage shock protein E